MSISCSFIHPLPLSGDSGVFAKASLSPSVASVSRGGGGVALASYPSRATVSHAATALGDEVQGVLQQQ